ncbi:MAG TPA: hypothetical protein VN863_04110 [Candidatus Dormibacteraeota bacterium]|jgi:hypothetical protein|nr:hypothetical protein [Candidatus Dormibacteraeota bacterium]
MPKFNRISLVGSEELFRPTRVEADEEAAEPAPADTFAGHVGTTPPPSPLFPAPGPAPVARERGLYRVQLSEAQIKTLLEAVQRMKYPAQVHAGTKPSIEEFETLDQLRSALLDALD